MKIVPVIVAVLLAIPYHGDAQQDKKVRDRANDAMEELESGKLSLRFFNALTGGPVIGASVTLDNIGEFATDYSGKILFPAPQEDATLTVTFRAAGFITAQFPIEVMNGTLYFNRYSMSPALDVRHVRIVLDWGEVPRDLDLHFVKEGGYHISYRDMESAGDGAAQLDRDDTHGFGPETITVEDISSASRYECYVHDYSDRSDEESMTLSQSHATVKLYGEGRLLRVFQVPRNVQGTTWKVFEYVDGKVNEIGTINP